MRFEAGRRVHFVGIGGAGMSAIAKVLVEQGVHVSGSDLKMSRAAAVLVAMGASVHIGHDGGLVDGADAVVASSAIPAGNPELRAARARGIAVMSRGEALAAILSGTRTIAVAGTHGKTTTTSMTTSILRDAGLDPTYLIGGGLNDSGTNAKYGVGEFAIAETDESDGSFLLLEPEIAIVTNVEIDHVDYWGSLDEIKDGFRTFLRRVKSGGTAVVPDGDDDLIAAARAAGLSAVTFGDDGDIRARAVTLAARGASFELETGAGARSVRLRVPGAHNVANALAASGAAVVAGLSIDQIAAGLEAFRGVERRFQVRGSVRGITIIDDYAHHPTEVRATLAAARSGAWRRVVAVFQPHRYSRTKAFRSEFGAAFADADRVVVTDVYGAGEQPEPGVSGKLVADSVYTSVPGRPVAFLPHRRELVGYLVRTLRPGDAVLTLGAGDITSLGDELLACLDREEP